MVEAAGVEPVLAITPRSSFHDGLPASRPDLATPTPHPWFAVLRVEDVWLGVFGALVGHGHGLSLDVAGPGEGRHPLEEAMDQAS